MPRNSAVQIITMYVMASVCSSEKQRSPGFSERYFTARVRYSRIAQ
ncbi:hypothetical protein BH11ACT2_BH11ACT2_24030 [soil metagenome]